MPPRYGSPGIPFGNEVKIIDESGNDAADGQVGELLIRGDNVTKGYYKNPEATDQALDQDGWLHSGDLAYRDADGYFFISGRIKELIIKGGENIAPREIDDVLYQHEAVLEAAAFPLDDPHYGQEVMACVALKPGMSCSSEELGSVLSRTPGALQSTEKDHAIGIIAEGSFRQDSTIETRRSIFHRIRFGQGQQSERIHFLM